VKVTLVSYSQPSLELQAQGITNAQELVAYCARVSNPSNQHNTETSQKLIRYLVKHGHWSPLEMVSACLEIETTRDIARQILRHRSFSFQEFSQRYAVADVEFENREARLQDTANRQNSTSTQDESLKQHWVKQQQQVQAYTRSAYQWALARGIAKEQARAVLPEGMTASRLYMQGTLRSWVHYIELRSGHGTQLEHQVIAQACADTLQPIFPMIREFVATE
jgi:thymidylate synthase (FAD)